jgi:hypothetical protein
MDRVNNPASGRLFAPQLFGGGEAIPFAQRMICLPRRVFAPQLFGGREAIPLEPCAQRMT